MKQVFLLGTPNVGKSTLFRFLTDSYAEISNYPGTTVEIIKGKLKSSELEVIDTPGINALCLDSDEEKITFEYLEKNFRPESGDLLLNVVNATTLQKDFFLTLTLIDLRVPFVLVLNQFDQIQEEKLALDLNKLEKLLGLKVLTTTCKSETSFQNLRSFILDFFSSDPASKKIVLQGNTNFQAEEIFLDLLKTSQISQISQKISSLEERIGLFREINSKPSLNSKRTQLDVLRRKRGDRLFELTVQKNTLVGTHFLKKLSDFLVHPVFGTLSSLVLVFLILYQFLGVLVAGNLVDFLEKKIFNRYYLPFVSSTAAKVFPVEIEVRTKKKQNFYFPQGTWLAEQENSRDYQRFSQIKTAQENIKYYFSPAERIETADRGKSKLKQDLYSSLATILFGNYGIFTLAVTYLLGVLLPMVWCFYLVWALLEDSGYLPRLAALTDSWMKILGLNGRGIIPLVLGFGCVTMATVTTRLMSTKREQIILLILLGLAVPCSAQLSLIQGLLISQGGFWSWLVWVFVILALFILMGFLANQLIPGRSQPLLLDLSPMKVPFGKNIFYKANQKSFFFLKESSLAFLLASSAVCLLQVTGLLEKLIALFEPLVSGVLGLPKEVALSFLLGIVRRDFGAFGLLDLSLNQIQVTVACVSLTLFVPCVATIGVMIKEAGWKIAMSIWFFSWLLGFSAGFILKEVLGFIVRL